MLLHTPGSHYQLETEVYTTAMYGDQFTVISRYTLVARGAGKAHLHVLYAIAFKPSLSRLMKPMVAKGVDGEWSTGQHGQLLETGCNICPHFLGCLMLACKVTGSHCTHLLCLSNAHTYALTKSAQQGNGNQQLV